MNSGRIVNGIEINLLDYKESIKVDKEIIGNIIYLY